LADANPFRFSTKYLDAETGLYYYGYRYYMPETGRWLGRDPLGEESILKFASHNQTREEQSKLRSRSLYPLYLFCGNNSIRFVDPLGLDVKNDCDKPIWVRINNQWVPVYPGQSLPGETDGVSWGDFGDHKNQQYKWVDCFDATVTCTGGKCEVSLTFVGTKHCSEKPNWIEKAKCYCGCVSETIANKTQESKGGWVTPLPWPQPPNQFPPPPAYPSTP
jgi:RHS repeat-associated protein